MIMHNRLRIDSPATDAELNGLKVYVMTQPMKEQPWHEDEEPLKEGEFTFDYIWHVADGKPDWHNDETRIDPPEFERFNRRQALVFSGIVLATSVFWLAILSLAAWWGWN